MCLLALILSRDRAFAAFLNTRVAQRRRTPCDHPSLCARQPVESHMWHHEDAGGSTFPARAARQRGDGDGAGHYNDPGIIERSRVPRRLLVVPRGTAARSNPRLAQPCLTRVCVPVVAASCTA